MGKTYRFNPHRDGDKRKQSKNLRKIKKLNKQARTRKKPVDD